MAVPDFQSLMLPVLKTLSTGKETTVDEMRKKVALAINLTQEDLRELLPRSKQTIFTNRISWAIVYLRHAELAEKIRRGVYRLTSEGEILLSRNNTGINMKTLENYPSYINWRQRKNTAETKTNTPTPHTENTSLTPEELMESAAREINSTLADEILERVQNAAPEFLERIVANLLTAMGYGGGDPKKAKVTGGTGDGGIDGIIREDSLGLDEIYLQAKKYATGRTVGENDLRNFAGAIDTANTTKGVFVTTSSFTKKAIAYVEKSPKRIILINGKELARLMIEHGIGIRLKTEYKVNRIDEDYFDSDY